MTVLLRIAVLLNVLALLACQPTVTRQIPEAVLDKLRIAPNSTRYTIDSQASLLVVKVYRDGQLASLGHNHVISSRDLQGEIYLAESIRDTAFEIRLPVATLDIDSPALRAAAGDDFSGELDADAISGTRSNLLGEQQLDVASWPEIVLRSRAIDSAPPDFIVKVDMAFQTHISSIAVPVQLEISGDQLKVAGTFTILQTEFGMQPFSVMMGALQVRNAIDVEFHIVALARL